MMIKNSQAIAFCILSGIVGVTPLMAQAKRVAGARTPHPASKWHIAFALPTGAGPQKMLFSVDGRSLYVLLGDQIQKWNVKTRRKLWTYKEPVSDFDLSPDGKTVALVTSPRVSLCAASSGKRSASLPVKAYRVTFSPDGKWLATAGDNGQLTGSLPTRVAVVLWRRSSWRRGKTMLVPLQQGWETIKESFQATALDFSPNSQRLVVTTAASILLEFDVDKGWIERPWSRPSRFVQFASDGRTAIGQWENVIDSEMSAFSFSLFDPKTWTNLDKPNYPPNSTIFSAGQFICANALAYTPDSQTIAAAWANGFLGLFDTKSGKLKSTLARARTQYGISCLAFSPDGKQLASGSWHQVDFWQKSGG